MIPSLLVFVFTVVCYSCLADNIDSEFCTNQGGTVYEMAVWNLAVNTGTKINTDVPVCFVPNEFGSNNYTLPLQTLANTEPTLAVLAFKSRTPPESNKGNIAHSYCIQLHGTTVGSNSFGRMSWYIKLKDGTYDGNAYDFCVFGDGSSIGTWTLAYHANDETRGSKIQWGWNE
eukprot:TRINITY_DN18274_c0_g1_i1.p1 TRINITY_DN18274_c0_g1~~TRINITY_DN18274_c0_g1_i1.p1  ORF type:complete len:173 (-),score=24.13 TRINITY_DN18274_c0_g1_i1:54-572(-)